MHHHHTVQILAISCSGTLSTTKVTSKTFSIVPAPLLIVTITLAGNNSEAQTNTSFEATLVGAVASNLEISSMLVKIQRMTSTGSRRQLGLSLSVVFEVLTKDLGDANMLKGRVSIYAMQV
jgi:hypothetical protein